MQASCDASIIIDLPKDEKLIFLTKRRYSNILIPSHVLEEHKKPKEHIRRVRKLIREGFFKKKELKEEGLKFYQTLMKRERLGKGECATIALALQLNLTEVLLDDKLAIAAASKLGLKAVSISYLPLWGFKKRIINKNEAERIFRKLFDKDDPNLLMMLGMLYQM